jgi:hypothetical protein
MISADTPVLVITQDDVSGCRVTCIAPFAEAACIVGAQFGLDTGLDMWSDPVEETSRLSCQNHITTECAAKSEHAGLSLADIAGD